MEVGSEDAPLIGPLPLPLPPGLGALPFPLREGLLPLFAALDSSIAVAFSCSTCRDIAPAISGS
jgi:hypothetical protein